MKESIYCKYNSNQLSDLIEEKDKVKVIQIFSDGGVVIVGKSTYPITYGGLYFIDNHEKYSIQPEKTDNYLHNIVMVSGNLLDKLAKLLDFEKVMKDIFKKNGSYYLPLDHYKIVDTRYKEINTIYNTNNDYSKALIISKVMDLFNYVVVTESNK